jgi:hypothetical protein
MSNHLSLYLVITIGTLVFSIIAYIGLKLERSHLKYLKDKSLERETVTVFEPDSETIEQ